MKIMIPVRDGFLTPHFGHCQEFTLIELDQEAGIITRSENLTPPPHEPGVLPKWIVGQGADLVIAGGLGQKARNILEKHDVEVVTGAPNLSPVEVVELWQGGQVRGEANYCNNN